MSRAWGRRGGARLGAAVGALGLLGLLGLPAVGGAGCSRRDRSAAGQERPAPLSDAEKARGRTACEAYAERVCRCAKSAPELAKDCELAGSRPEAFELTLRVLADPSQLSVTDQQTAQLNARKIVKACLEADAVLDPAVCAR